MSAFVWTFVAINALGMISSFVSICKGRYPKTETKTIAEAMVGFVFTAIICVWGLCLLF